jgi:threonine dehydrogenase-like Zn-dependent dehydrogenase
MVLYLKNLCLTEKSRIFIPSTLVKRQNVGSKLKNAKTIQSMDALLLLDNHKLILKQIDTPTIKENEVLIDVQVTGIGGSEYLGFNNTGIRPLPNIMGHGITGTTKNGKRIAVYPLISCEKCEYCTGEHSQLCDDWKLIGVQLNGGFAQKVAVPQSAIFEIPDELSWEQSSFIEPFANSVNAWELAQIKPNQTVLVIGAGSLGLGLIACAKDYEHENITILENSQSRKQAAIDMGAKDNNLLILNSFDVVFDTVGSTETRNEAFKLIKKNGKCVFLGFAEPKQVVNFSELIRKQIQIIGSFVYSKEQFEKAIHLSKMTNRKWVENLSFTDVEGQLQSYLSGYFNIVKAALRPNGVESSPE